MSFTIIKRVPGKSGAKIYLYLYSSHNLLEAYPKKQAGNSYSLKRLFLRVTGPFQNNKSNQP